MERHENNVIDSCKHSFFLTGYNRGDCYRFTEYSVYTFKKYAEVNAKKLEYIFGN